MAETVVFPGEPRKNDALFLEGARKPLPFVYAYEQRDTEVVGGPSCKPVLEIDLDKCENDVVPVLMRRGGGGTVVLAPGMVVTIIVGRRARQETPRVIFDRIHMAMVRVLADLGIAGVDRCGLSDLAIDEKKILGSSLYLGSTPFLYYYQSSLIVDANIACISRYLRHPPREPDYRNGRSHGDFVSSLQLLHHHIPAQVIIERFNDVLPGMIA
jgi:lipoate---protein ligase